MMNINKYSEYMSVEQPEQCITHWMFEYIVKKNYNTPFGDLVPLIVANILGINIGIVENHENGYAFKWVLSESLADNHVHILKTGDHYDAFLLNVAHFERNCDL